MLHETGYYAQLAAMSEPELPGIPPPPEAQKLPWYRRLLARWKWSGWGAIGLGGGRVFHVGEDIDFALNFLRGIGGDLGLIATILASPFFALALIVYGIAHLIFVGEPNRPLRHHAWTYVGWAVFGICFSAIAVTAVWGGIQAYIAEQVTQRSTEQFWHLRPDQIEKLGRALDAVPADERFPIRIRVVFANAQALTIGNDLIEEFHRHGWPVVTGGQDMNLRPDLIGINFVEALDWPRRDKDQPPHVMELVNIFNAAGIKFSGAWEPRFDSNSLQLAIGSRPSDW